MGARSTTRLSNWRFWDQHVQSELEGGQYVNASTVLVAAGPPRLSDAANNDGGSSVSSQDVAYPIGVIENFGLAQNRGLQRMFEIGSRRSYFIPGRTIGSISFGRVLYYGPSLLRAMYAYYPSDQITGGNILGGTDTGDAFERDLGSRTPEILENPGYGKNGGSENKDFFINLASDLFDKPLGLLIYMRDSRNEAYGAFYLEDTYISSHSFNINASSVLTAESVTAQYDRLVPININNAVSASSIRQTINLN